MAIVPPGLPGRLPTVPVPPVVHPTPPVVPVLPADDHPVRDMPLPPRPRPGSLVDTWAKPGAGADPSGSAAPRAPIPMPSAPAMPSLPPTSPSSLAAPSASPAPAAAQAAPPPLAASLPLPVGEPDAGLRLADALRSAIASSGVFYESHLADWVEGRRGLPEIRAEAVARSAAVIAQAQGGADDPVRAQQVDLLRQGEVAWTLPPPWHPGEEIRVAEEAPTTWDQPAQAARIRLDLDLPGRGRVAVTLRVAGDSLDVSLEEPAGTPLEASEVSALALRLGHLPGARLGRLARERHGRP